MKKILWFGFILPPFTKKSANSILNMMKYDKFIFQVINKRREGKL